MIIIIIGAQMIGEELDRRKVKVRDATCHCCLLLSSSVYHSHQDITERPAMTRFVQRG